LIPSILANLLSNAVWLLLGVVLTGAVWLLRVVPKYRRLTRFFGISRRHPRLRVYFSRLNIQSGGAVDARGTPRSYAGVAIPEYELAIMDTVLRSFVSPQPKWVPEALLKRLESLGLFVRPEILLQASPARRQEIPFDNMIVLGSRGYNEVTGHYLETANAYLALDLESGTVEVKRGARAGERIVSEGDLAILLKIRDTDHGTVVFIGAGLGVNGTRGAVEYLMEHWAELQRDYDDAEFGLCLRFPPIGDDAEGFRKPAVLCRLPK